MDNGLNVQNILTLLLLTECSLSTTVGDDCFLKCFISYFTICVYDYVKKISVE